MSVRSRIDKFESLSDQPSDDNRASKKKRFKFPGKNLETDTQQVVGNSFVSSTRPPKHNGYQDFDADLQEVWSVRKNIHHTGSTKQNPPTSNPSGVLATQASSYSRHGAIPAQPTRPSQVQPASKDPFNRGSHHSAAGIEHVQAVQSKRTPLQDYNSKESPWNVKKGGYNFRSSIGSGGGMAKRPIDSPKTAELSSVPAAKRRVGMEAAKLDLEHRTASFPVGGSLADTPSDKVGYAKKMARGYMKSVGIGEFTPKSDMYSKESRHDSLSKPNTSSLTKWKKLDDDQEFEFDV